MHIYFASLIVFSHIPLLFFNCCMQRMSMLSWRWANDGHAPYASAVLTLLLKLKLAWFCCFRLSIKLADKNKRIVFFSVMDTILSMCLWFGCTSCGDPSKFILGKKGENT